MKSHHFGLDKARLARVLGLLGSAHPGERDAAGLKAHELVRNAGTTWEVLLGAPPDDTHDTIVTCLGPP
jgi:hypothetical protein